MPVVDRWFKRLRVDDDITLLWEPHVIPLMRCNIWHVRGRDRDLVVDTGMGVASLVEEMQDLLDKPVTAVATHGHDDHIGSHHEFCRQLDRTVLDGSGHLDHDEVLVHPAEADSLRNPTLNSLDPIEAWGAATVEALNQSGYVLAASHFVTALPAGAVLEGFHQKPAQVTRLIDEGDLVDLGNRRFEVLHLPGHSPGSIGLWEAESGTLFSGDAIYDGPLLDELPGSDIARYCATMRRLMELPVDVVHAGHDPSFGRDRLRALARNYLDLRDGG